MRKKNRQYHAIRTFLPVIILFGILAVSQGSYRGGYGASSFLYLQPTVPQFQRAGGVVAAGFAYGPGVIQPTLPAQGNLGSVSFAAGPGVIQPMIPERGALGSISFAGGGANIIQPNLGTAPSFGSLSFSAAGGPIMPTYGPGLSFGAVQFGYRAYHVIYPVETIYTTPTRALIKTDIGYRYSNVAYVDP